MGVTHRIHLDHGFDDPTCAALSRPRRVRLAGNRHGRAFLSHLARSVLDTPSYE